MYSLYSSQYNAQNALIAPFDMHTTLFDIMNGVKEPTVHKLTSDGTLPRGKWHWVVNLHLLDILLVSICILWGSTDIT